MPFDYQVYVTGKNEYRVEVVYMVEKRKNVEVKEDENPEKVVAQVKEQLKNEIVQQIQKEVKLSVATGVSKEATAGKTESTA